MLQLIWIVSQFVIIYLVTLQVVIVMFEQAGIL